MRITEWASLARNGRWAAAATLATLVTAGAVHADSKDGAFPTAQEVGGEVFPRGLQPGTAFPTDFEMYDESGRKVAVGELIKGKRSVLAFFISGVPVSVEELKKLQKAKEASGSDSQLLFINADTVGTGLTGGPPKALNETLRTVRVIKQEEGINHPMFVAPNDVLSQSGLSNRLGFRSLPTVFIVGADGKVEKIYVGPQDWGQSSI